MVSAARPFEETLTAREDAGRALAEVAEPRALFAEALAQIAALESRRQDTPTDEDGAPRSSGRWLKMKKAILSECWLFYVQHPFEMTFWTHEGEWTFQEAALHGSSPAGTNSHDDGQVGQRWGDDTALLRERARTAGDRLGVG